MAAPERLAWTADVVAPAPTERILEVGCGHGVLLSLLAGRLTTGTAVGVDRSATMGRGGRPPEPRGGRRRDGEPAGGEADRRRPGRELRRRRLVQRAGVLTPPAPEWDVVDRVLAPDGRVLVAFSVMGAGAEVPIEEAVRRLAGQRGLRPAAVHRGKTAPMESVALELHRDSASPVGVSRHRAADGTRLKPELLVADHPVR